MIGHVLWGWCTIHALIYLALAWALFWAAQYAWQVWSDRRSQAGPVEPQSVPLAPSWARGTAPFVPAGSGRHRKPGSTR